MNATETIRAEIDDHIRGRPELFHAITEATRYLEEQAGDEPPPETVSWRFADKEGTLLQLSLSDPSTPQGRTVQHDYWTRWILDPVNQKICVLKTWVEFLGKRSDTRIARIAQLIARLKEEQANGGENAE